MSDSQQAAVESDLGFIPEMDSLQPNLQSLERTSRHLNQKCDGADPEEGEGDCSDSGVFNSSKNTVGSTSDNELTDEYERPGCIDYFPEADSYKKYTPKASPPEYVRRQFSAEEVDTGCELKSTPGVCSYDGQDEELSEVVVHKNQYKDSYSYGTEMTTFRKSSSSYEEQNRLMQDENSVAYDEIVNVDDDDNDDSLSGVSVHQKLYRSRKGCDFTHMDAEDEEEYETEPTCRPENICVIPHDHRPRFCRSSLSLAGKTTKDIDYPVSFPLKKIYPDNKYSNSFPGIRTSRASNGTCIEERIKPKLSSPPFGDPVSVRAVNRSVEELLECTSSDRIPSNLPYGAPVGNNTEESGSDERRDGLLSDSSGKKKRKKKKSSSKDDGGGDPKDSYDVNGNPVDQRSSLSYSSEKHVELTNREGRSMHRQDAAISHFPKDISSLVEYTPGNSLTSTDMQSSSDPQGKRSRLAVRKKKEENNTVKSENIPGHRGSESNLDALLDFIENNQGGKKKKKLIPVHNGPQNIFDKDKNNLRKIKKGKPPYGKEGSERAGSDNSSEKGEEAVIRDFEDKKPVFSPTENSSTSDLKDTMVPLARNREDHDPAGRALDVFNAGGSYIFTDFETPAQVEEEFQVVSSKPKKKKVPTAPLR